MARILFITDSDEKEKTFKSALKGKEFLVSSDEVNIEDILKVETPDIVILDCDIQILDVKTVIKTVKHYPVILILYTGDKPVGKDITNHANLIISKNADKNIISAIVDAGLRTGMSLRKLADSNQELARSLYQLNVLYNTSSQFAGTLDKDKLYNIMLEALEKTLSFDISCALVFGHQGDNKLFINSLYEPTESLKEALALRVVLEYKNLFENQPLPHKTDLEGIEIIKNVKPSHIQNIFDLRALNYDSLFAPIKVGEHFFGVIELFRKTPFTKEDVTCFQTIVHQVALPLRSATLYEEIKNTNVKLEKLERLKSDFVSIVSHELRTPLTPINNSLEIVLSEQTGPISDDAKNFINMAKRNVTRLSGIIEDLLDLSRVQTGKLDFKYKITSLVPSLELIQKTFEQVACEKDIQVSLQIENNLEEVYADSHRIEQIISNLVTNALKFTPKGGNIKITAQKVNENEIDKTLLIAPICEIKGNYIKISVKDTGIGIKKEDIPKIFEKFSQIENSLTRNIGGVGLGLSITKQLLDAHLGAITVKSKENEGSDFSIFIPIPDERKIFIMDINHALSSSEETGIIHIKEKSGCNFIDIVINENLIKLTKKSKELRENNNYYAILPDISQSALDFMEKTILSEIQKRNCKNCDIVLKRAHTSEDGKELLKILTKINI